MNSTLTLDFSTSCLVTTLSPRQTEVLRNRPKLSTICMISVHKTFKESTTIIRKEITFEKHIDVTRDFSNDAIQSTIADTLARIREVDGSNDVTFTIDFQERNADGFSFHKSSITIKEDVLHKLDLESVVVHVKGIMSPAYYWIVAASGGAVFSNILGNLGDGALTSFLKAINGLLPGSFNYNSLFNVIVYLTKLVSTGRVYSTIFKAYGGYFKDDAKYLQVVVNGNIRMKNDYFTVELVKDSMGFLLYAMDDQDDVLINDIEHLERNVVFKDYTV